MERTAPATGGCSITLLFGEQTLALPGLSSNAAKLQIPFWKLLNIKIFIYLVKWFLHNTQATKVVDLFDLADPSTMEETSDSCRYILGWYLNTYCGGKVFLNDFLSFSHLLFSVALIWRDYYWCMEVPSVWAKKKRMKKVN